eukprot:359469-Chlamydomonas_euryale.AAC.11
MFESPSTPALPSAGQVGHAYRWRQAWQVREDHANQSCWQTWAAAQAPQSRVRLFIYFWTASTHALTYKERGAVHRAAQ